jgi:hypothetical protein
MFAAQPVVFGRAGEPRGVVVGFAGVCFGDVMTAMGRDVMVMTGAGESGLAAEAGGEQKRKAEGPAFDSRRRFAGLAVFTGAF